MNYRTRWIWLVIIIIVVLGWFSYQSYKHNQEVSYNQEESNRHNQEELYWQRFNTPTVYTGNGYKMTFPCGDINNTPLLSNSDFNESFDMCEYFGGDDHSQIDIYKVNVSQYLSNQYNPYDEAKCSDYTDDETRTTYHVIYNETRTIDGHSYYICGWDSKRLIAKTISNNTIYGIEVMPRDSKTMYQKLNNVLATFQLTAPTIPTAKCRDGTYSSSQNRSGTCSDHGGVSVFYK